MRKCWTLIAGLAAVLFLPAPARAWSDAGHRTIASIAYRRLDPVNRKRMALILRQHPHFASRWKPGAAASGIPADNYLFQQAAVWPDTIRGDARYDHPTWHYVNRVYSPTGDRLEAGSAENLLAALDLNKKRFIDARLPPAERAVALSWVFHLLGDLHQPFHAVTLVSPDYPQGDRGGNDFWVRTAEGPVNLHAFWDRLLNDAQTPQQADTLAERLLAERKPQGYLEWENRTVKEWLGESYRLAVAAGYQHAPDPTFPYNRVPLEPAATREAAKPLPGGYAANARSNAERRVVLAGYRLARALDGLAYGQP